MRTSILSIKGFKSLRSISAKFAAGMFSASSSGHLRSAPRSFPSVNHALRTLYFSCNHARFLSARSTGGQHSEGAQLESYEHSPHFNALLNLLSQTRDKLGERSPGKVKLKNSHFKQMTGKEKEKNALQAKRAPAAKKKSLAYKGTKSPETSGRLKFQAQTGEPGTGKTSQRKWKRDVKTLSELIQSTHGTSDSELKSESWKDDWGEDELVPKSADIDSSKSDHKKLPSYVRRIEGLIEHSEKDALEEIESPTGKVPIATLAHGLDRVLFNPGVHWVQDPRSRVYNFTPFIQNVPDIKEFAFERLTPFIRSSRDSVMRNLAVSKGKRFAGSTSSLTGLLCHIYFLLSQDRNVDVSTIAEPFSTSTRTFTPAQRMPTAVVFNHRDGVYMIDSDSTDNDDSQWNILMWMGTMLENFFTLPKSDFSKLLRSINFEDSVERQPEAYRYSQSKSFVMRSQLDCVDSRLPGSGVFDIKTRAALPLRLDNLNFKENSGYLITSLHGSLNSFDREYYDLIRSAFLKYSFQVRIGGMDGIFLAYHNTARVFGFQYVPLEEMDQRLFGDYKKKGSNELNLGQYETGGKDIGWRVFHKCVSMLEVIAAEVTECFPGKSVACLAETRKGTGVMRLWVQPVDEGPGADSDAEEIPIVMADLEKPIIQLDITAQSFLGDKPAIGSDAIFGSRKPWTVHWSISRSSSSDDVIRGSLAAAKKRKYRPKPYPTGVNAENLEEFMRNLGFGNPDSVPDRKHFMPANASIRSLRKISRAGQLETQRLQSEEEVKGVQIWQQVEFSDPSYHLAFPSDDGTGHETAPATLQDAHEPSDDDTAPHLETLRRGTASSDDAR